MTNFDKWLNYMRDFRSPQSYIDMSFYAMIGACLARRVFLGAEHSPLYPNQYVILVGEPGIGKGLVIKQVEQFLKFHKRENPNANRGALNLSTEDAAIKFATEVAEYEEAMKKIKPGRQQTEKPLRLPVAANAVTYEALCQSLAESTRTCNYKKFDDALQKMVNATYVHRSILFCLEEISSLFRKKTEDVVNFLIQAYDCGDYEYKTKTQGTDEIRKMCVNFFGGTTPGFMRETFNDKLLNEGFASRTLFIFAAKNRHNRLFIPELDAEQKQCKVDILSHIGKLLDLYGQVQLTTEARQWLAYWFEEIHPKRRSNTNLRLNPYYARKDIHVQKLAMCIHFAESTEMLIGKESCEKAVAMLDVVEKHMHYAVSFDAKNPLAPVARKIEQIIQRFGPQSYGDLLLECNDDARDSELKETIEFLSATNKIQMLEAINRERKNKCTVYHCASEIDLKLYPDSKYANNGTHE